MLNRRRLIVVPLLLLFSLAGQAALYKWVDENGNVHYSDKNPAENAGAIQTIEETQSTKKLTAPQKLEAITRPANTSTQVLYLDQVRYIWDRPSAAVKRIKAGVYHIGEGCTSRGAMKMPQSSSRQTRLFPEGRDMTGYAFRLIRKLDYPTTIIDQIWDARSRRNAMAEGLVLRAEIIGSDYDVCARQVENIKKYGTSEKIPYWEFTKHRLKLEVKWVLRRGIEGPVMFEATSVGKYSNWKTSRANWKKGQYGGWKADNTPTKAFTSAMTKATMALFADPGFLQMLAAE